MVFSCSLRKWSVLTRFFSRVYIGDAALPKQAEDFKSCRQGLFTNGLSVLKMSRYHHDQRESLVLDQEVGVKVKYVILTTFSHPTEVDRTEQGHF